MAGKNELIVLLVLAAVLSSCYHPKYDNPADFQTERSASGKSVVTIRYVGKKWRDINVPPRINGKRVIEIGENTFADIEIAAVTIPNGIRKIGAWSFSGNYISEFNIPKTVTEIGTGAFMSNRLGRITIPGSVRKIGYRAFCENPLESITIGKNVNLESIGGHDSVFGADWVYYAFELGLKTEFDEFYKQNGRKAGTYILSDGVWSMQSK